MVENSNNDEKIPIVPISSADFLANVCNEFEEKFKTQPDFCVKVPGRVNIIGEHIDYCGYPVLPMAIEQCIIIAAGYITEPKLILRNIDKKYEAVEINLKNSENIEIKKDDNGRPFWYNYVLCGIKGALEHLNDQFEGKGLRFLVAGNIPPASGLSSSSALVSASCLACLYSYGCVPEKSVIASLCAQCERYIGTEGGGMDQAIAFLAKKGCAQYITWNPLKATSINMPEDVAFVVAHSLSEANKAADNDFNTRVIECRLAAKIIANLNNIQFDNSLTLSLLQKRLNKSLEEMPAIVLEFLPKLLYTREDVCKILGISDLELEENHLTENTKHLQTFKIQQRSKHVYEEALRVERFRILCTTNKGKNCANDNDYHLNGTNGRIVEFIESKPHSNTKPEDLGRLLRQSHESLQSLYECSHNNLDKLVNISDKYGAWSRLTGAGWGGCIVAMCHKSELDSYIATLQREFYSKFENNDYINYVFSTQPNQGAEIFV